MYPQLVTPSGDFAPPEDSDVDFPVTDAPPTEAATESPESMPVEEESIEVQPEENLFRETETLSESDGPEFGIESPVE